MTDLETVVAKVDDLREDIKEVKGDLDKLDERTREVAKEHATLRTDVATLQQWKKDHESQESVGRWTIGQMVGVATAIALGLIDLAVSLMH